MASTPEVPYVPTLITVHLGPPNSPAQNVSVLFPEYIKNVASSELYPTWPENAISANIYAQTSFALNRVFTKFYRSQGYDFDITNSSDIDQAFVNGRSTFSNINKIVDKIFNEYLKRPSALEPLATKFSSGITVTSDGLSKWGSVELANQGYVTHDILNYYYGPQVTIVRNAPIQDFEESFQGAPLLLGNKGHIVEKIQNYLNVISNNYPIIPKIFPVNGVFGNGTESAVKKFQEIFGLTPDGIVGKDTWYKINYIYIGIKKLAKLILEGLYLSKRTFESLPDTSKPASVQEIADLKEGSADPNVRILQYFLDGLSTYYTNIPPVELTGIFDKQTKNAVIAAQRLFNLPETGVVDDETWNYIYNYYITFSRGILERLDTGGTPRILPFPGTNLQLNSISDDVRTIQYYLNVIATRDTELTPVLVTGVYGPGTRSNVLIYQRIKGLPQTGIVDKATWDSIASTFYDVSSSVSPSLIQYPGFPLSIGQTDAILKKENRTMGTPILNLEVMLRKISFLYDEIPYIIPNGLFGNQTLSGVLAFQKLIGLPQTGIVDEQTWNSIVASYKRTIEEVGPPQKIQILKIAPNFNDYTNFLKIMINTISKKYVNCIAVDTAENPEQILEQNIKEMQKILNLSQSGLLDKKTWDGIVTIYEGSK